MSLVCQYIQSKKKQLARVDSNALPSKFDFGESIGHEDTSNYCYTYIVSCLPLSYQLSTMLTSLSVDNGLVHTNRYDKRLL
jgi:hypothetical protein